MTNFLYILYVKLLWIVSPTLFRVIVQEAYHILLNLFRVECWNDAKYNVERTHRESQSNQLVTRMADINNKYYVEPSTIMTNHSVDITFVSVT